jgi:PilZ domain
MIFRRNHSPARRSPRQWWNSSVQVLAGSAQINGLGVNISDGGMCLFAVANLPLGSQLEVEFRLPHSRMPVRLTAAVRHRALYLYGLEFLAKRSVEHATEFAILNEVTTQ